MSLQSQLPPILYSVRRPSRYIGHEWNRSLKDPNTVDLNVVLAFPDGYEIGMSYPGFQILYHILNRRRDVNCERVYAPFPDMEKALRDKQLSLFSLENYRPISEFDVIGFTLQYELHATNLLTIFDLAGIPLWSSERDNTHPLIIAGGPCAYNPEPLAPFLDAVLIGDGEEAVHTIVDTIIDGKKNNLPRNELLKALAQIPGVYIPQHYHPQYFNGRFSSIEADDGFPMPVIGTYVKNLIPGNYPEKPLVPVSEVSHNRLQVEIMRGCTRGCRFCHAGTIYRPLRERAINSIVYQTAINLDETGFEELSLVSLSTSDYSHLEPLLDEFDSIITPRRVSLSFPSLRPDTFSDAMALRASAGRTGGITFAPEAATDRLRAVINKPGDDQDLFRACTIALKHGWRKFKLYFMIGLPTETEDDLGAIGDTVKGIFRLPGNHNLQGITLSISPFVPKAHTPFQRMSQITGEELYRKISFLKNTLPSRKVKTDYRDPKVTEIEGLIARGDRRIANVIYDAWRNGARFCGWTEHFRHDLYQKALTDNGLSLETYLSEIPPDNKLPWDHISKGIKPQFLEEEAQKAAQSEKTPDCREGCLACGLPAKDCFTTEPCGRELSEKQISIPIITNPTESTPTINARIKYSVKGLLSFLSHLEMVRLWERVCRRSGIPVQYTEGYRARPRLSFGPSKSVGIASDAEYIDIRILETPEEIITSKLSQKVPEGIEILSVTILNSGAKALDSAIDRWKYIIEFEQSTENINDRCNELLQMNQIEVTRHRKSHRKAGQLVDIRPSIAELSAIDREIHLTITKPGPLATIPEILALLNIDHTPIQITRTGQWISYNNQIIDPIEANKITQPKQPLNANNQ